MALKTSMNLRAHPKRWLYRPGCLIKNSVSLSATLLNVEAAYEVDGKTSTLNVRLADAFNNPVPDGTAAIFFYRAWLGNWQLQYLGRALLGGLDKSITTEL